MILFDHNLRQFVPVILPATKRTGWLVVVTVSKGFDPKDANPKVRMTYVSGIWSFQKKGYPDSSIFIGFSFINHPIWDTHSSGNLHIHFGLPNGDLLFLAAVLYIICRLFRLEIWPSSRIIDRDPNPCGADREATAGRSTLPNLTRGLSLSVRRWCKVGHRHRTAASLQNLGSST